MKIIKWKSSPKNMLVVDAVAPNKKRKLLLSEAAEIYEKKKREFKDTTQWNMNKYLRMLNSSFSPKTDLSSINFETVHKIVKSKLPKERHAIRQGLGAFLRLCLLNEINTHDRPRNGNGTDAPINLKIQSADISTLPDLLLAHNGKHMELRTQVLDAIAECPANEYRVIQATEELINNPKERQSVRSAITKSIKPKGWTINWSSARKVFFVVRSETLKKIRKGGA